MGVRLRQDEQPAFLERGHTGILATVRRDGRPVSLPSGRRSWTAPCG